MRFFLTPSIPAPKTSLISRFRSPQTANKALTAQTIDALRVEIVGVEEILQDAKSKQHLSPHYEQLASDAEAALAHLQGLIEDMESHSELSTVKENQ